LLYAQALSRASNSVICGVPELARFFGVIIRMFAEPSERHHVAHFPAYYQEHVALFANCARPIDRRKDSSAATAAR
jgi:hypothetical protein